MAKRMIGFLLALVMILGIVPATAVRAETAGNTLTGIRMSGYGLTADWETGTAVYSLQVDSLAGVYESGTEPLSFEITPLYFDSDYTTPLMDMPARGTTFYFTLSILAENGAVNAITNENSRMTYSKFSMGKILATSVDSEGNIVVECSIMYGKPVEGVTAHARRAEYNSELGAYAPQFSTLHASSDGTALEEDTETGDYKVDFGGFYLTNDGTTFSDPLTVAPQVGETYYSYISVHNPDGELHIQEDRVRIRIDGYEVNYLGAYAQDMGKTILIVYSATRSGPDIYVGGVGLYDNEYVHVGATSSSSYRGLEGYAHYADGVLTLVNYSYEGAGYDYGSGYAIIYTNKNLEIALQGNNTLIQTELLSDSIYVQNGSLTIMQDAGVEGPYDGSLTTTDDGHGIWADGGVTVREGTVSATGRYSGIRSTDGDIVINGGNVTAAGNDAGMYSESGNVILNGGTVSAAGLYGIVAANDTVTVTGGSITATGSVQAIAAEVSFTAADYLLIQASATVDGALGAYVEENHSSYKKITIEKPDVFVGGIGLAEGKYLAVGAAKATSTKPAGGYAYYEDGVLTLSNYSYEGAGFTFDSRYDLSAVIYADQNITINLAGTNTLVHTTKNSCAIYVPGGMLTIDGTGSITTTAASDVIYAGEGVEILNGTLVLTGQTDGISSGKDINIENGSVTVVAGTTAISANRGIYVTGGRVSAKTTGGGTVIGFSSWGGGFHVTAGMKIQAATTIDGPLVDYEYGIRYKRIEIGPALPQGPTLVEVDGQLRYVVNGEFSEETTLVEYEGETYYVVGGVVNTANTLFKYNGKWHHVNGGKWVKDTTLVKYGGVWHYVKDGIKNNANTLVKFNGKWYHVNGGVWVKDTTLVKYGGVWHYVQNGVKTNATTLVKYNGSWFYVKNGVLNTENTLCKFNGLWYHVNGGKWVKDTTLVKYGGVWHYVQNGIKTNATTLVKYNGSWFYVKNGVLNTENTLCKFNGLWYHVNGGKWVKDTTLVKYGASWVYVKNGVMNTENTLCKFNGLWYHVNGGKWVKDTTLVKYGASWLYVRNGVVDFTYNGTVVYNGKTYTVKNGIKV